jgi:dihydrofolate synthase/folylpolyglutamate synthase
VVQARADALGCEVVRADPGPGATIGATNAALAGAVLDALGRKGVTTRSGEPLGASLLDAEVCARARLVGRMERFTLEDGPRPLPVVLDGAHVPFNIAAVLSDLAQEPDLAGHCIAVVALARDKDARGFLTELGKRATAVVCTSVPSAARGRPADELKAIAASLGIAAEVEPDPHRAFRRGLELAGQAGAWLLVTGSLYLVGALRRDALAPPRG